jgi:hypothetical protein
MYYPKCDKIRLGPFCFSGKDTGCEENVKAYITVSSCKRSAFLKIIGNVVLW